MKTKRLKRNTTYITKIMSQAEVPVPAFAIKQKVAFFGCGMKIKPIVG